MSKKSNEGFQSIGGAIRELLNSYRLDSKYDETNVINSWEKLVGKPIAKRTKRLYIKNKVLFVEFDSPSMRHDFSFHKSEIIELFRKEFGKEVVNEIVVL